MMQVAEGNEFVQQELEADHEENGCQLDVNVVEVQDVDANPQNQIAQQQASKTDRKENAKAKGWLVLDFEVISPVEKEAGGYAGKYRDAVGNKIMQPDVLAQAREDAEIEEGGEAAYYPIQDKIPEFAV